MDDARASDQITDVVRTHRIEVVDHRGRLRAVLDGGTEGADSEPTGLRIFDRHGHERITLAVQPEVALLSFALSGNTVVELGCYDMAPEPGAYLVLCDGNGSTVLGWSVTLDGDLIEKHSQAQ